MIILFGAQKGGTGKSTLAQNVAVALAREGRDIVLLDTDVQGTTAKWMARRRSIETVKSIHCLQARGNLIDPVRDLAARYGDVVIDVCGADRDELRTGMLVADQLVVPVQPSQADLETMPHIGELVSGAKGINPGLQACALVSRAPVGRKNTDADDAREFLADSAPQLRVMDSVIYERSPYREAQRMGLGVLEYPRWTKARVEVATLVKELFNVEVQRHTA